MRFVIMLVLIAALVLRDPGSGIIHVNDGGPPVARGAAAPLPRRKG